MPKGSFHGIHLASITRTGQIVPILPGTEIHTGDTLRLVGLAEHTKKLGKPIGYIEKPSDQIFGAYVLRGDLKNSQLLAGSIAGGRSCTPALGSVMTVSGSNIAMLTYPVTYTIAQVYLTLFGPVIVAIVSSWGQWAVTLPK